MPNARRSAVVNLALRMAVRASGSRAHRSPDHVPTLDALFPMGKGPLMAFPAGCVPKGLVLVLATLFLPKEPEVPDLQLDEPAGVQGVDLGGALARWVRWASFLTRAPAVTL